MVFTFLLILSFIFKWEGVPLVVASVLMGMGGGGGVYKKKKKWGQTHPRPPSIHTHTHPPPLYPHCGKPFVICIFICIQQMPTECWGKLLICVCKILLANFSLIFLKNRSLFLILTSLRDHKWWICEFTFVCRFILIILCTIHCFLFVVREKCFKQPCSERKQKDWANLMFNQLRNLDLSYSVMD